MTPPRIVQWHRRLYWLLPVLLVGVCVYLFSNRAGPRNWAASAIAFSPEGDRLIVGTYRWRRIPPTSTPRFLLGGIVQSVKSLDPSTGRQMEVIERTSSSLVRSGIAPEPSSWIAFSPDGQKLAIGHWDGRTLLRNVGAWKQAAVIGEEGKFVTNVNFLRDGTTLCVGHRSFPLIWELNAPNKWRHVDADVRPHSTSLSPDGKLLAFASGWFDVSVVDVAQWTLVNRFEWNATTGELLKPGESESNLLVCDHVAFTPDGQQLVVALREGNKRRLVLCVETETGREIHRFKDRHGVIRFSSDKQTMAIGGYSGLSLIALDTNEERYIESRQGILDLRFSPDSKRIVFGDWDGWAECRDASDGKILWRTYVGGF